MENPSAYEMYELNCSQIKDKKKIRYTPNTLNKQINKNSISYNIIKYKYIYNINRQTQQVNK